MVMALFKGMHEIFSGSVLKRGNFRRCSVRRGKCGTYQEEKVVRNFHVIHCCRTVLELGNCVIITSSSEMYSLLVKCP